MILAIDTAGPVVGAAIGEAGGPPVQSWSERVVRGADGKLTPAVARLIEGRPLTGVAVSVGPGAFTSLRVGVATALGIAVSRGVPIFPCSALVARRALVQGPRVLALLDGRKGRAYAAFFVDGDRADEVDVAPDRAIALAGTEFRAVGEGALVWRAEIEAAGGALVDDAGRSPTAGLLRLAATVEPVDPMTVRLNYIREADAVPPRKS